MTRRLFPLLLALMMLLTLAPLSQAEELPYAKIDWYIGLNPLPDLPVVNEALNEYLMENLNCEVNLIYMQSKEWLEKIGTMIASGQDMGILGFGSQSKSDYVIESQRGAYYPLDELLETYGQDTKALFSDAIWDAMKIGGHVYGIPTLKDNGYFISLIYNQEMADEFGIDIDSVKYSNFRDLEDLFREVKGLRDAAHPEWAERPIAWDVNLIYPYNFAFETFLNDSYLAVCNIDGIMDID
ncbi:MAG TPA: extracellular solute-binding protein, partial [Clostridia bacterium]|nr:extracellular solute-binding protein [Clostridia bacterium]